MDEVTLRIRLGSVSRTHTTGKHAQREEGLVGLTGLEDPVIKAAQQMIEVDAIARASGHVEIDLDGDVRRVPRDCRVGT